eukprot:scaffold76153_cov13-Tisochrysis_lutea.AAC.2
MIFTTATSPFLHLPPLLSSQVLQFVVRPHLCLRSQAVLAARTYRADKNKTNAQWLAVLAWSISAPRLSPPQQPQGPHLTTSSCLSLPAQQHGGFTAASPQLQEGIQNATAKSVDWLNGFGGDNGVVRSWVDDERWMEEEETEEALGLVDVDGRDVPLDDDDCVSDEDLEGPTVSSRAGNGDEETEEEEEAAAQEVESAHALAEQLAAEVTTKHGRLAR